MRNLFRILFVLLLVCSCADDPGNRTPDTYPVRFTSGLSGQVLSRVAGDNWETNDPVGIYMVPATAYHLESADFSDTKLAPNKKYLISAGGSNEGVLESDGSANTLYYPIVGDVNFVAYYPYKSDTHTNGDMYQVNVQDQTSLPAIDLLYHRDKPDTGGGSVPVYNRSSASVPMKFYHQLSKMTINVVPFYDDTEGLDWETATVELRGFPTTAEFDLSTGVLDNLGSATPLTLTPLTNATEPETPVNQADFEAIVVPHSNSGDEGSSMYERTVTLRIKLDGVEKTYTHMLSGASAFEPGKTYQYNYQIVGGVLKLVSSTIDNWDEGAVHGGNYSLLASRLSFDLPHTLISGNTVTIMTNAGGPAFTLSKEANSNTTEQPEWITGASLSDGTADTSMGDGWMKYTLTFDTEPNNGEKRTDYIRVWVAGLSLAIRVTQEAEEANSFMVAPDATLKFYPGRAFSEGGADLGAPLSVEILWADTPDCIRTLNISGTGNTSVVTVTAGSNPGNALIAVKNGGGVICWSYHIWVTDYCGESTWVNSFATIIMDRNLGAKQAGLGTDSSTGLLYQWGRKDPFPATKNALPVGSWSVTLNEQKDIQYTVNNPDKFIGFADVGYYGPYDDWLVSSDNELWGYSGGKSVYDPCPAGWRVVRILSEINDDQPWAGYNFTTDNGFSFGEHAIFPNTPVLFRAGEFSSGDVNYWTATIRAGRVVSLNYFYNGINAKYGLAWSFGAIRTNGFPVRCVRE